ncbi:MAG: laccase domain-containing protein [Gammaproteobacteria bacterium]
MFTENWCTYSRNDLFYSYRKEPTNENRMYSIIWIK